MAVYVVQQDGGQGVVRMTGDLIASAVPGLQAELKALLGGGVRELVFDLGGAAMLDSTGIGLLIAAANSTSLCAGRIEVINVSADISKLLQSMRLTDRLNVKGRKN